MDIEHPTGTGREGVDGKVDTTVEPLQGRPVGTETGLVPRIVAVKAVHGQQAERQRLVDRQLVLAADNGRGGQHG